MPTTNNALAAAREAHEAGQPTLNPALRGFWLTPTVGGQDVRVRVLHGGRYSSKTWDAAGFAVALATQIRVKFLCTRQFQNKIEESVYSVLKTQIERFGLQAEFKVLNNRITHLRTSSEFVFYGLWRNIDEIKSLEGIDVCWIEEAHNLREDQWRILRDTVRKPGSQFWIIFNPRLAADFVYRRFVLNPPPRTLVRQINYPENPFLPETVLQTIEEVRQEDEGEYHHVMLGQPRTDDSRVVIQRKWIEAAIDAHKRLGVEPSGLRQVGFDPADAGEDKCALVGRHGIHTEHMEQWKAGEDELFDSCAHVWHYASEAGALIGYDAPGVGAGCGSNFRQLNDGRHSDAQVGYFAFQPGGSVQNPDAEYQPGTLNRDHFFNRKAQCWWSVADRFRATYNAVERGQDFDPEEIISISSELEGLESLIVELSTPYRHYNANGKVMVERKDQLADRGVESPNRADAFIIAYSTDNEATANVFIRRNKKQRAGNRR